MCNLYSMTKTRDELVGLFDVRRDTILGSLDFSAIYPDRSAPVVRLDEDGSREISLMRWGFPPPPKVGTRPVTNVRNGNSSFWRHWLKPEFRCLVPATAFCEWTDIRPKVQHWFSLADGSTQPVFAFAGIWRPWTGTRKGETGEHRLFSFLTCEPNDLVRPFHAKAMPVILADEDAWDAWLTGSIEEALELQRPCPAGSLIVQAPNRTAALLQALAMLSWWRQRKKRQQQVIRDADNLMAIFGNGAYSEALARARHEDENDRDPSHWFAVRREIARRTGKDVGLDTATRYLDRQLRAKLAREALEAHPDGIDTRAIAMHVIEAKGLDASDRHVRNAIAYKLALRTSRRINLDSVSGLPDVAARHSVAQSRMFIGHYGSGSQSHDPNGERPCIAAGYGGSLGQ